MAAISTPHEGAPLELPRSTFITALAWISIAMASLATFVSVLQAVMFFTVFTSARGVTNRDWPGQENLPSLVRYLFTHPELLFGMFWTLSALTLIAGIGLLRRRNWARLYFIAILAFGIFWQASGVWIQREIMAVVPPTLKNLRSPFADEFELAERLMSVGTIVFAVLICILFAWLIKRLVSKAVRVEFTAL